MAEAAEKQVKWIRRQYHATLWEIGALLFTVIFTAWAAVAASKAAGAADRAVQITSDTAQRQLRAYVFHRHFETIPTVNDANEVINWRITPVWENAGATPTRNANNHVSFLQFEGPIPADYDFPDVWSAEAQKENILIVIGPRAIQNASDGVVPIDILVETKTKNRSLYIWGWIDYNDIFSGTVRHRTEFCFEIQPIGDPRIPNPNHLYFRVHWKHNGTDEECYRKPKPFAGSILAQPPNHDGQP